MAPRSRSFPGNRLMLVSLAVHQYGALHQVIKQLLRMRVKNHLELPDVSSASQVDWADRNRNTAFDTALPVQFGTTRKRSDNTCHQNHNLKQPSNHCSHSDGNKMSQKRFGGSHS